MPPGPSNEEDSIRRKSRRCSDVGQHPDRDFFRIESVERSRGATPYGLRIADGIPAAARELLPDTLADLAHPLELLAALPFGAADKGVGPNALPSVEAIRTLSEAAPTVTMFKAEIVVRGLMKSRGAESWSRR